MGRSTPGRTEGAAHVRCVWTTRKGRHYLPNLLPNFLFVPTYGYLSVIFPRCRSKQRYVPTVSVIQIRLETERKTWSISLHRCGALCTHVQLCLTRWMPIVRPSREKRTRGALPALHRPMR
ncbi:hypothetical protein LX36DRAFT_419273 [Colletotrichum falcatum]|nr:hypothetical protein LX36DRAFT_419273 [Colletotrichum falcatum]